jgi:hypothetical protein
MYLVLLVIAAENVHKELCCRVGVCFPLCRFLQDLIIEIIFKVRWLDGAAEYIILV